MAKAKTKAAVKGKPAAPKASATKSSKKAVSAKAKPPKTAAVKKTSVAKPAVAKTTVAAAKPARKDAVAAAPKREPLSLPAAKIAEPPKPVPAPRKLLTAVERADLPPEAGFTLLVDGHFKNGFEDLKNARAAASELKGRFPMLRVEIYDAARKARLPV